MSTCKNFLVFCVFVSLSFFAVNAKNAELKNTKNVAVAMVTKYTKNQEKNPNQKYEVLWMRVIDKFYEDYELYRKERQETVKWLIAFFPDNPEILPVAMCESSMVHREKNGRLKPNDAGSSARGALQILVRVHKPDLERQKLNINNNYDYFRFAKQLFDNRFNSRAYNPWNESRNCWQTEVNQIKRIKKHLT